MLQARVVPFPYAPARSRQDHRDVHPFRIVTNIWDTYALNIMKIPGYFVLIAVFVILLAVAAGCTTPQQAPAATQAPQSTAAPQQAPSSVAPAATRAAQSPALDMTINVHRNELVCIDIQEQMGTDYLYPDQKFRLDVTSAGANTINPTIVLVDKNNEFRIREVEREWNTVQKTWVYDGVVTVLRLSDITKTTQKEFTIKDQGKYYLCADDRKESGSQDTVYQVPFKLTRL
jgi:hypothetical protein